MHIKLLISLLLTLIFATNTYSKEMNIWIMPNGANSKGSMEKILGPTSTSVELLWQAVMLVFSHRKLALSRALFLEGLMAG